MRNTKIGKSFRKFLKAHHNFDLILSVISLVLIWRGIWSITDMFLIYNKFDLQEFLAYLIPLLIGFFYIYFNDLKLGEISHGGIEE